MGGTPTKTIWQYSEPLPEETMAFLRGIALDYNKVKNHTYKRYAGIKSLGRLTPAYDIMAKCVTAGFGRNWDCPPHTLTLRSLTQWRTLKECGEC